MCVSVCVCVCVGRGRWDGLFPSMSQRGTRVCLCVCVCMCVSVRVCAVNCLSDTVSLPRVPCVVELLDDVPGTSTTGVHIGWANVLSHVRDLSAV